MFELSQHTFSASFVFLEVHKFAYNPVVVLQSCYSIQDKNGASDTLTGMLLAWHHKAPIFHFVFYCYTFENFFFISVVYLRTYKIYARLFLTLFFLFCHSNFQQIFHSSRKYSYSHSFCLIIIMCFVFFCYLFIYIFHVH